MKKALFILLASLLCWACDDIDCTLNNTVECKLAFYDQDGKPVGILDTLDVYAEGLDDPLYNRATKQTNLGIPLSYYKDRDTLQLVVYGKDYMMEDWLVIEKENIEHFESLNCPVKMFHTLKSVSLMSNEFIDSVTINYPNVEYNNGENIKIYLHTR
ncbi:MAG: DUF6452 family protein [Bacteroidaceae bacterium]|nr:DUF6452 family protein [Bacteroidaceae bacterium]